jgi:ApaG protein
METQITNGIRISVETFYQEMHSDVKENRYVFAYRITIDNQNDYTVQLLRRYWQITNGYGAVREVEGEGVIGQQPILLPNTSHQYTSWSDISTDIGKMSGHYLMERRSDGTEFLVQIPEFKLIVPSKYN